jgi:hypothetical protein
MSLIMTSSVSQVWRRLFQKFQEDYVQIPTQKSRIPRIRPNVPVNCPDAHQSATSIQTMWQYSPDAHQRLKTLNCSRLHPSGRNGKSSGHSSKFEKNPGFKWDRPNNMVILFGRRSVFDQLWDFFPKHRYGKITSTIRTMWIPVRTLSFIRQVVYSKFNRLDNSHYGPDTPSLVMEIAWS